MNEYKKEAPRLFKDFSKSEEKTIEYYLAQILYLMDIIESLTDTYHVNNEINIFEDSVRKAWDLAPEKRIITCPRCKHEEPFDDEPLFICKECYDTFTHKV